MTDVNAPLGLIAGLGDLPVSIAKAALARGQSVYVLRIKGFVEPQLDEFPGEIIGIAQVGKQISALKKAGCRDICFAGIVKRPDFSALKPDMKGMMLLPKVLASAQKGDDALLRTLIDTFETEGFRVIGAEEAAGDLRGMAGAFGTVVPDAAAMEDLRKAAEIAAEIGRLDIGQGAIVASGLVLCVEAQEGTDAMLKRCAELDPELRGTATERLGVLVKRPKPIQERRIDLPTLGVRTVEGVALAGLAGIGFEEDGALIVEPDAVRETADRLGIFLYGFAKDWA